MSGAVARLGAVLAVSGACFWPVQASAEHPGLLLTPADVALVTESLPESPTFAAALRAKRAQVDRYFETAPDVPEPTDPGGGYSHEQHKRNGIAIHDAGVLYQLTGERIHASRARDLLLAYAEMYPRLGPHPVKRSSNPGRLFWQTLNECVWLVYAIQGFDAIHETLSEQTRERIEMALLRPMAEFLSVESPQVFNRIHNHGTWAVAAVGMVGYVLDDPTYVDRALHGLAQDGNGGFMRQLDALFSPDGYYSEGPYYQRYALMPFLLFAQSIDANDPDLKIFEHRDGILLKAIYACADLSYAGLFFPLNDAIKDKGLDTIELRYGFAIAYGLTEDPTLLSLAAMQSAPVLTGDGFRLARGIDRGEAAPYDHQSRLFRDGPGGSEGVLAVLRSGVQDDPQALVLKATAQGMSHGHFDKLGLLFYDNGAEILMDYGAARFLNVEQKNGGAYLPENESWAKQTVAHNTLVVDGRSHFDGELGTAEEHHPTALAFASTEHLALAAAQMRDAYPGVPFDRTIALIPGFPNALGKRAVVLDVLNARGSGRHQYDLPLHFNGQIVALSHDTISHATRMQPLGKANGYQHLWLRASSQVAAGEQFAVTWLTGNRFYTYRMIAGRDLDVLFAELGASDPNFNLRRQQALIFRVRDAGDYSFVSVLEPHGQYNGAEEFTVGSRSAINGIRRQRVGRYDALCIAARNGESRTLLLSYDPKRDTAHSLDIGGVTHEWRGYFGLAADRAGTEITRARACFEAI